MFNDKSTAAERQQVLQAILRRGAAAAGGSPHTPAEVNALLARSAEELAAFEDMDAAAPPPRLLRPEEVCKSQCHFIVLLKFQSVPALQRTGAQAGGIFARQGSIAALAVQCSRRRREPKHARQARYGAAAGAGLGDFSAIGANQPLP